MKPSQCLRQHVTWALVDGSVTREALHEDIRSRLQMETKRRVQVYAPGSGAWAYYCAKRG